MATDDVNEIKARWYKENLMGRVADKMKEILSPRGEKFFLFYNPNFQNFESEIEYKGRILSVWAIYPYSEVGDYDIGEPEYCANLGDKHEFNWNNLPIESDDITWNRNFARAAGCRS